MCNPQCAIRSDQRASVIRKMEAFNAFPRLCITRGHSSLGAAVVTFAPPVAHAAGCLSRRFRRLRRQNVPHFIFGDRDWAKANSGLLLRVDNEGVF